MIAHLFFFLLAGPDLLELFGERVEEEKEDEN